MTCKRGSCEEVSFGELFCGIGGFRFGLEKAISRKSQKTIESEGHSTDHSSKPHESTWRHDSFSCVWANDIDKYACQIYRKHYGTKELIEGDIRDIKASDMSDFDFLTAGFPCQSFSVAGKRKGITETRGTLFAQIVRVASAKKPKLLLLENVKGLLSSDDGRDFAVILRALGNLGYLLEWQVLNSKYFGVPQNRERVFIIGHLRGTSIRTIFPVRQDGDKHDGSQFQGSEVASTIRSNYPKNPERGSYISRSVRSGGRGSLERHQWDLVRVGEVWEGSQCRVYDVKGISPTVHKSGGNTEPMIVADRSRSYTNLGRNLESPKPITNALTSAQKDNLVIATGINLPSRGPEPRKDGLASTIKVIRPNPILISNSLDTSGYLRQMGRHEIGKHGLTDYRIRRLTPIECERLQGFPDNWTEGVSDTQRYKLLGNAVTTNVITFLGTKLLESLHSELEVHT